MNRTRLKNYAPQARRDFIQAVTDCAAYYGLTAKKIEPIVEQGDVAIIGGKASPRTIAWKRKALEGRVRRQGFEQTMEAMAYTWFNRLVAIRFMELHGYLDHGYRVLSHPEGKPTPEILEHAEHVDLPGLDKDKVIELKLDGTQDAKLYRMLLIAQCNALHSAMPFLFERIDDETELLLPDNLLYSDSLIRKLVNEIDEEDWQEIEIIGWLYQFYISEKKDEVIGKVVKSEDIPAATQLFTPNWIVKYLVQNTLGRQWLATYPNSPLRRQMEYYIEPAEQTPEVQAQLKAITPESLNPEELTLLDPACGSGHILVEAYDLFKAIYQERGYRAKDIPALILRKNLFGLEICDRAAQLAAFALMMKARADDRRIFAGSKENHTVQPHVMALVETKDLNAGDIAAALSGQWAAGGSPAPLTTKDRPLTTDIRQLIDLFAEARTFGSLIQVAPALAARLPLLEQGVNEAAAAQGELFSQVAVRFLPVVEQARLLARQYDCVVANPPYMGAKYCNPLLKGFLKNHNKGFDKDLFSAFVARNQRLTTPDGYLGFMMPFVWMFISSHETLRELVLNESALTSIIQLEYSGFAEATVPICTFTLQNKVLQDYTGSYIRLTAFRGAENQAPKTLEAIQNRNCGWFYTARQSDFRSIPGQPIAYWISKHVRQLFPEGTALTSLFPIKQGMATSDNNRFLRLWHEVDHSNVNFTCTSLEESEKAPQKWYPYTKGGEFRCWYGNNEYVVNWQFNGKDLKEYQSKLNQGWHVRLKSREFYFKPSITWSFVSSSYFGVRFCDRGFIFDVGGSSAFPQEEDIYLFLGFLCSNVVVQLLEAINPTLNFQVENIGSLPALMSAFRAVQEEVSQLVEKAIWISREDWDSFEISWNFSAFSFLAGDCRAEDIEIAFHKWERLCQERIKELQKIAMQNNTHFIEVCGLADELSPEVPDDQITLYRPNREQDIKRLLSYAIGCMMGRYSLDKPGLIYAHSGNQDFWKIYHQLHPHPNPLPEGEGKRSFLPDADGIIPITDTDWFPDDAANRIVEFIAVAWPNPSPQPSPPRGEGALLEENLKFIADSLGPTNNEQPRDTIRRYLATSFFKDHLKTYKRRPIYWLFSSGKQRAFQCLVYLHRYHEGTLSRMRTEYVIPLQGKIAARIDQLADAIGKATSTSHRKKLEKERDTLLKQQAELQAFDEKLRHYADRRIRLDLDDGVKVNYGRFGDLLAEVKSVTGGDDE